jgi:predicted DNA-binding transcriptional regulator AlpA
VSPVTHPSNANELLSIPQVLSELNDIPRSTFYRWRATGRGPKSTRLPNGRIRIRRSDLQDWLETLTS